MFINKDTKPFLIKFPIGIKKTNKSDMQYQDSWDLMYGLISNPNGSYQKNIYGYEGEFDRIITVVATPLTRRINGETLFLVESYPTDNFEGGDYSPKYIFPEQDGQIKIGLVKKESINIPKIYFESDLGILYYQINFDQKTLKAYVPVEQILPFSQGDYVWTRDPITAENSKHKFKISSESKVGFDKRYKPFRELILKEV